jgi:hypothetical protein
MRPSSGSHSPTPPGEQKLRSSIVVDGNGVLLPAEQVMLTLDGISIFAGEVADFRFVWFRNCE